MANRTSWGRSNLLIAVLCDVDGDAAADACARSESRSWALATRFAAFRGTISVAVLRHGCLYLDWNRLAEADGPEVWGRSD